MTIGHEGWWTSLRQRGRAIPSVMPAAAAILLLSLLAVVRLVGTTPIGTITY